MSSRVRKKRLYEEELYNRARYLGENAFTVSEWEQFKIDCDHGAIYGDKHYACERSRFVLADGKLYTEFGLSLMKAGAAKGWFAGDDLDKEQFLETAREVRKKWTTIRNDSNLGCLE
jgi:hypothetical protein